MFQEPFSKLTEIYAGNSYAHMEIVVVLIVVKFEGSLVITRDHGSFESRHQVEILPTGLPELFKPARDLLKPRKFEILGPKFSS